jgi:alpha-tubulin suppressor-like RCC1 family protein
LAGVTAFAASKSTANSFSIALTSDGTVVVWGEGRQGQTAAPAGLSNVTAVSAGELQALALNADGTVASWGWGNPAPPGLSNVVAISAAGIAGRNLALTRDGRVVDWWARPSVYDSKVPEGLGNIIAISAGWSHGLALRNDGTVVGWGSDDVGQATGVSHTAGGSQATGLVMVAGQVVSNVVAVAAAHDFSLALKKDGTVASWGRSFGVALPAGLDGVVVISAAGYYCLAITTNPAVAARFRPSSAERSQ